MGRGKAKMVALISFTRKIRSGFNQPDEDIQKNARHQACFWGLSLDSDVGENPKDNPQKQPKIIAIL